MRTQKHRQGQRKEEAQPENQPSDQRDEELTEDTDAVLDDIACCLAEVEEENELAAKKAAKAEWDEIARQVHVGDIDYDTYWYNRNAWILKYQSMFRMVECCGSARPDFGDLE